jgi:hypothetical protein
MLTSSRSVSFAILMALIISPGPSLGAERSQRVVREFVRSTPCPVEGPLSCFQLGYEVEHSQALICGGRDHVSNLVWYNRASHKIKTKDDVRRCRGTLYGFWMRLIRDAQFWK